MVMRFKYVQQQLPSGKRWEQEAQFESEQDFLRHLNDWNRRGAGTWLYHSIDLIVPHIPITRPAQGKALPEQHVTELDRLVATGVWSKDSAARPDEIDEIIGEIPSNGC